MKFITYSLSHKEEIKNCANGNEHHQRQHQIMLDASSLNDPQLVARSICDLRRAVAEEAIDNGQVEIIADDGAQPVGCRSEDVQDAVDHALIHELIDDVFRKPVGRLDKGTVIKFIEVIFVLEQRDLEAVFRG